MPTTIGVHCVAFGPQDEVVVVTVPSVVVLVVVVVVVGHASPAGRGMHTSVSTSLSDCFGFVADEAVTVTLHLPAFVPFFFSFVTIPDIGPQLSVLPAGVNLRPVVPEHFPATFNFFSAVPGPVHVAVVAFAHTFRSNVHDPFGVATPSASHVGSQSVHVIVPPFVSASGTPTYPTRHSLVAARAFAATIR